MIDYVKKELTWDDLADIYNKHTGGLSARCQSMDAIVAWAKRHPEIIFIDDEGYFYRRIKGEKEND